MWQVWFGLWTDTAVVAQSMYLRWILSTLPLVTPYRPSSASDHSLSSVPMSALQCPGCDSPMVVSTQQQPQRAPSRWLNCPQCGVSQLLTNPPVGGAGDYPRFPTINGATPGRGIPTRR